MARTHSTFGVVWRFRTKRLEVALTLTRVQGYRYDGDDEGGHIQALLDSGDMVAFDALVSVTLLNNGLELSWDSLGGNVYMASDVTDFHTAHRDGNPMNRNCSIRREIRGDNSVICHYFPDMVRQACREARDELRRTMPRVRQ